VCSFADVELRYNYTACFTKYTNHLFSVFF